MTTQKMEPHAGDRIVNFEGAAIIHTEANDSSKAISQCHMEEAPVLSESSVTDETQSKMRAQWNSVMCKEMQVPQGYQNVAVLIIKWTEELDELHSADEVSFFNSRGLVSNDVLMYQQVRELDELLRESFNYSTEIFEIDVASSPKLQLKKAILDFVYKYNGPHNLLIVYYTGHGSYNELTKQYVFHAYVSPCHES